MPRPISDKNIPLSIQLGKTRALRVLAIYRADALKPRKAAGIGDAIVALVFVIFLVGLIPGLFYALQSMDAATLRQALFDAVVVLPPLFLGVTLASDVYRHFKQGKPRMELATRVLINFLIRLLLLEIMYDGMPLLGKALGYPLPAVGLGWAWQPFLTGLLFGMMAALALLILPSVKRGIKHRFARSWGTTPHATILGSSHENA